MLMLVGMCLSWHIFLGWSLTYDWSLLTDVDHFQRGRSARRSATVCRTDIYQPQCIAVQDICDRPFPLHRREAVHQKLLRWQYVSSNYNPVSVGMWGGALTLSYLYNNIVEYYNTAGFSFTRPHCSLKRIGCECYKWTHLDYVMCEKKVVDCSIVKIYKWRTNLH